MYISISIDAQQFLLSVSVSQHAHSMKGHASLWQFIRIPGTLRIIAQISQKEHLPIEKSYSDE